MALAALAAEEGPADAGAREDEGPEVEAAEAGRGADEAEAVVAAVPAADALPDGALAPRYCRVRAIRSSSSLLSVSSSALPGSLARLSLICESWYYSRTASKATGQAARAGRVEDGR